jgi:hypothetical protein
MTSRMPSRTTAAAAALALLLLPSLAACGGSGGGLSSLTGNTAATSAPDTSGFSSASGFSDDTSPPDDSGSGGGGGAAGCTTLLSDLTGIEDDLSGATSAGDLAAKVKTLEAKLTQDASTGTPALQTAVKNYNTLLTKIVKDATGHNASALSTDEQDLATVATKLGVACE